MRKNKILVFGKGYIGTRIQRDLKCDFADGRINSYRDAHRRLNKHKPDIIINCIGHLGTNVDYCEKNIDQTLFSNVFVPFILAEAALRHNCRFIHISSGCIYDFDYQKDQPIDEEKIPDFFQLFYSRAKFYSEQGLKPLSAKFPVLILRLRIPLDTRPHPRNLLTKLIHYKKVIDLPNSVTYFPDFLLCLRHLIKINARGIYNCVNKGGLSFSSLMEEYRKYYPEYKYRIVSFKELGLVRTNLVLSTKKLEQSGFKVRSINSVIKECVREYVRY